jgi:hypothetical protein
MSPSTIDSADRPLTADERKPMDGLNAFNALPPLLAVPAAAKLLGISRSAAYRYASTGELPTRHLGGRVYIVTALLRELISTADNGNGVAA